MINNYPMDNAYALWSKGEYPSQHLWGKIEMDKSPNIEMVILKHEKYKFLNRLGNLFKIKFLDQQIRTLWVIRKFDIIYAPYATANTKLLILLKFFKLMSTPIVIMVHQPMFGYNSNSRFKKFVAKKLVTQYDSVVFISEALREDLIRKLGIPKSVSDKRFFHADWGADTEFYKKYAIPKAPADTEFAISAGKTDRDFETIVEAFKGIDFPLRIYCTPESMPHNKEVPKNVNIYTSGISYIELLKEYNNARVILIPLQVHRGGTQGQTSLIDAYAMGKPIAMTYNKNIDFDLEKEGIGCWTEQDNMLSWRTSLNKIIKDEAVLKEMGEKSMKIFKEKCNSGIFGKKLEAIFTEVYMRTKNN